MQANSSKSAVYIAGVPCAIRDDIRDLNGFTIGSLPFKYLGIPLSSRRLSIADCEQLADKMLDKLKGWSAKHFSYAARFQIINSILMGVSAYWCQNFYHP